MISSYEDDGYGEPLHRPTNHEPDIRRWENEGGALQRSIVREVLTHELGHARWVDRVMRAIEAAHRGQRESGPGGGGE